MSSVENVKAPIGEHQRARNQWQDCLEILGIAENFVGGAGSQGDRWKRLQPVLSRNQRYSKTLTTRATPLIERAA